MANLNKYQLYKTIMMIVTNEYIIRLNLKYWTSDRDEKGSFNVARFL